MSGTFNVSRDLWTDPAFRDEPFSEREAWVWMISEASWKDRERRLGSSLVSTQRGQLAASIRFMAERFKWSPPKVQRFIKRITDMKLCRVETDTGISIITICKYEKYQGQQRYTDTAPIQRRYSTDTNEKKEERKKEDISITLPWFDEFWSVCPRKVGKGQARRAYAAALKKADPKTLISAMRAYGETRRGQDEQYTAHPATWLNGERWADAPAAKAEPKVGDVRKLPDGRRQLYNGKQDGWFTIHEDDDGDGMGNPARSGDQRSVGDWNAEGDLPGMQPEPEAQARSLPLGDVQAGWGGVELLALRRQGGAVL